MFRYVQIFSALMLISVAPGLAFAGHHEKGCGQGEQNMHHHGQHGQGGMLGQVVDLSDEQRNAYTAIQEKYRDGLKALNKQKHHTHKALMALDPQDAKYDAEVKKLAAESAAAAEKRTLLMAKKHAEVMALLTDEQKQSLREHHQQMMMNKEKHQHKMKGKMKEE